MTITTPASVAELDTATSRPEGPQVSHLDLRGPYDLEEVALMGFGHRDERSFDGVMRLAFCLDGDHERQVGVEVRQQGQRLELRTHPVPGEPRFSGAEQELVRTQVARVLSADHDGDAFAQVCAGDPVLARLHALAPGFRPASFYSPYEAAVWSIVSARRARAQGIVVRERLAHELGVSFDLAGVPTSAVPTPSRLLSIEAMPGLPADRVPRLHAIATAASAGELSVERLVGLEPAEARVQLQRLPGIGPFYSELILVRACGLADVLPMAESKARDAIRELYGFDHDLTEAEYADVGERWRPFRTWATVLIRAVSPRLTQP